MRVLAPAKINLHLRVGPAREDGFHPLLSWMVTAGLFDTLVLRRIGRDEQRADAAHADFTLSTDHPSLANDIAGNLVTRVATALADTLRRNGEGSIDAVSAYLIKRIPLGAGLAGGSSDAAAALLALGRLWKLNWDAGRIARFSERFGSDVPFFFHGPSSVCSGRGEIVRPIDAPAIARWAVLALPSIESSTPAVYRRFDEMKRGSEEAITTEPPWSEWSKLPAAELMPQLVNDLEAPAFALQPQLAALRVGLEQQLGRVVRMSGSGSSLFTLCDAEADAIELANRARERVKIDALAVPICPPLRA